MKSKSGLGMWYIHRDSRQPIKDGQVQLRWSFGSERYSTQFGSFLEQEANGGCYLVVSPLYYRKDGLLGSVLLLLLAGHRCLRPDDGPEESACGTANCLEGCCRPSSGADAVLDSQSVKKLTRRVRLQGPLSGWVAVVV